MPPSTIEALERKYGQLVAGPDPSAGERWLNWIVFLKNGQLPIGSLQATVTSSNAEIAYVVYPKYWRNGFAKEGLVWLLNYLSTQAGVVEALASIDLRNAASIALARSIGFTQERVVATNQGRDVVFVKRL